ncbi:hypothetical protein HYPSUDRAFT_53878 [Hypholoma sublateritium FD-334 SS-4]|uniref:PARP catalytic domain-containing protein n=1 Tax=Hypholoma sublateritium (strain FD-334 SS-4) TaxID=945553 RepID=A0A0D2P6K9_HYPSF|nr:hypothetical protein HYPSUDRAFT_53878 [Hypholoma sublateritium FD-334 SS-4]
MVLFHGTRTEENVISLSTNVDLSKTNSMGDLHTNKKGGADGGAYFTDSLVAAAQYACYSTKYDTTMALPDIVYVASFQWTPGQFKVHEFSTKSEVTADKSDTSDMISGPMSAPAFIDMYLTPYFWQYAVVKKTAVAGLKHLQNYKVYCKNVPEGRNLQEQEYAKGQSGNPEFNALVTGLTSESGC